MKRKKFIESLLAYGTVAVIMLMTFVFNKDGPFGNLDSPTKWSIVAGFIIVLLVLIWVHVSIDDDPTASGPEAIFAALWLVTLGLGALFDMATTFIGLSCVLGRVHPLLLVIAFMVFALMYLVIFAFPHWKDGDDGHTVLAEAGEYARALYILTFTLILVANMRFSYMGLVGCCAKIQLQITLDVMVVLVILAVLASMSTVFFAIVFKERAGQA